MPYRPRLYTVTLPGLPAITVLAMSERQAITIAQQSPKPHH